MVYPAILGERGVFNWKFIESASGMAMKYARGRWGRQIGKGKGKGSNFGQTLLLLRGKIPVNLASIYENVGNFGNVVVDWRFVTARLAIWIQAMYYSFLNH